MDLLKPFLILLIVCSFSTRGQQNEESMTTVTSQTPSAASVIPSASSHPASLKPTSGHGGSAQPTSSPAAPSNATSTTDKYPPAASSSTGSRSEINSTTARPVSTPNNADDLTTLSTASSSRPTGGATSRPVAPSAEPPPDGDTKTRNAAKTTTTLENAGTAASGLSSRRKTPPTPPTPSPASFMQRTPPRPTSPKMAPKPVSTVRDSRGMSPSVETISPPHTGVTDKSSSGSAGSSGYSKTMTVRTRPGVTNKPSDTVGQWTKTSRQRGRGQSSTSAYASRSAFPTSAMSSSSNRLPSSSSGHVMRSRASMYTLPHWPTASNGVRGTSSSSPYHRTTTGLATARPQSTSWPFRHYVTGYQPGGGTGKPHGSTRHVATTSYKRYSTSAAGRTSVRRPMMTGREVHPTSSSTHPQPTTTTFWITRTAFGSGSGTAQTTSLSSTTNGLGFVTGWGPSTRASSKSEKNINLLALWICLGLFLGVFAAVITACLLRNHITKMDKWKQAEGVEKKLQDVEMVDFSTNVIYQENMSYKDRCQDGYPMATQYTENPLFAKGTGKEENVETEYLTY